MVLLSVHDLPYISSVLISLINSVVSKFAAAGKCPGRNLTENLSNIEHSNKRRLTFSFVLM